MTRAGTIIKTIFIFLLLSVMQLKAGYAGDRIELSDAELDQITAGAASTDPMEELASFKIIKNTRLGKTITAEGDFHLLKAIDRATMGTLTLTDNAQGNLQSLININAVNSEVNVLMNLNINIDSTVGSLNQFNINGILPSLPNHR